ncbi:hypothetical protein D9M70_582910 [compost metagenome]
MRDGFVLVDRGGQLGVVGVGLLAEVRGLEQFLDQDDLRALGGGLAHQLFGVGDVRLAIPGAGHLGGGDGDDAGHGGTSLARLRRSLLNLAETGDATMKGGEWRFYSR